MCSFDNKLHRTSVDTKTEQDRFNKPPNENILTIKLHFRTGKFKVILTYVLMAVIIREQVVMLNHSISRLLSPLIVEKSVKRN
jgi:hypothetical protein